MAKRIYVRTASGLVRELGLIDAVALGLGEANIAAAPMMFVWIPFLYPGANLELAMTLALLPAIFVGLVYGLLGAAMPRSGGDYTYIGRIIHPSIGFMGNWAFTIFGIFQIGAIGSWWTTMGLSGLLGNIGFATQNDSLLYLSGLLLLPHYTWLIGSLLIFVTIMSFLLGTKVVKYFHRILLILGTIFVITTIIVLFAFSQSTFVSVFNQSVAGTTSYDAVIDLAKSKGWVDAPPSVTYSLPALALAILLWNGYTYPSYAGGEIKSASRNMPLSITINTFYMWIFTALMGLALYKAVGRSFVNAIGYIATGYPADLPIHTLPQAQLFASMLAPNMLIVGLISIGTIAFWTTCITAYAFILTRNIFAWSFDRVLPSKLAYVSERFHAPVFTILTVVIGGLITCWLFNFTPYFAANLNSMAGICIVQAITAICALIFPWRRKDLFNEAPGMVKAKIGGVPIIAIIGAIGAVSMIYTSYAALTSAAIGPGSPPALAILVGIFVVGIIIYIVSRAYHLKEGIDLNLIYKELPPE